MPDDAIRGRGFQQGCRSQAGHCACAHSRGGLVQSRVGATASPSAATTNAWILKQIFHLTSLSLVCRAAAGGHHHPQRRGDQLRGCHPGRHHPRAHCRRPGAHFNRQVWLCTMCDRVLLFARAPMGGELLNLHISQGANSMTLCRQTAGALPLLVSHVALLIPDTELFTLIRTRRWT